MDSSSSMEVPRKAEKCEPPEVVTSLWPPWLIKGPLPPSISPRALSAACCGEVSIRMSPQYPKPYWTQDEPQPHWGSRICGWVTCSSKDSASQSLCWLVSLRRYRTVSDFGNNTYEANCSPNLKKCNVLFMLVQFLFYPIKVCAPHINT